MNYRRSRIANYDVPAVSFILPFYRQSNGLRYGGMGFNIISQQAGPGGLYKVSGATGTFAYTLHLSKTNHIGAGIAGGFINKRIDASGITTDSQYNLGTYDPSLADGENFQSGSITRPVVNAGLCWVLTGAYGQEKASLGVAAYTMNKASFDLLQGASSDLVTYVATGEMVLLTSTRMTISPSFRYIYQGSSTANIGARISYNVQPFDNVPSAGIWYKTTHALVAAAQYNYKAFVLGASMDFSIGSDLDANVSNAVEIALGWRMNRKERLKAKASTRPTTLAPAPKIKK
jgi:type IX secretion system PorP/SprF family membrane protein